MSKALNTESNARLSVAARELLFLLEEGFNITHDWESSVRKGYVRDWHLRTKSLLDSLL